VGELDRRQEHEGADGGAQRTSRSERPRADQDGQQGQQGKDATAGYAGRSGHCQQLEAGRPHQRLSLAGLLWPDMPDEGALNNLRKSLHRLHQTLDPFMPSGSDPLFTVTRQTIQLNRDALALDVAAFQELLAACEAHPHRHLHICQPCLSRLAQAVALYRGELLAGFSLADAAAFEEWLLIRREALQHQALVALYHLAAAHEQRGEYELAHQYAVRQVAIDPYREEAHNKSSARWCLAGNTVNVGALSRLRQLLAQELEFSRSPKQSRL
jgi:DNA-binding SARP family transcriptional activator